MHDVHKYSWDLVWKRTLAGHTIQKLQLSGQSPGVSAGVELLTGRRDGRCRSRESRHARYQNITHCWDTPSNLEQCFPNEASGQQK